LAQSIHPTTIEALLVPDAFMEMVDCLDRFAQLYRTISSTIDAKAVAYHKSVVLASIDPESIPTYEERLRVWKRLCEHKIKSTGAMLDFAIESHQVRLNDPSNNDFTILDINSEFTGLLLGFITQLFFSLEVCCKICCALLDPTMAKNVSNSKITHHDDMRRTLNRLSTAGFLGFEEISKIYVYSIKTRMIADYAEFFFDRGEVDWWLAREKLLPLVTFVFQRQKELLFECEGL
jgi:hypothetical protein